MTTELAGTVQVQAEVDLDALIAILDAAFFELPEQALRTCQAHRELVTPRLIEVLQEVVRLGREGIVREGNAHFFALFLLTEFESTEALPVILELYSLTDSVLENLLGDAITESTRRFLAVLAADEPDRIEALIGNRQINEYVRWEAAGALCNLVRDGRMPRDEAVRRLAGQMRAAIAAEDGWGVTVTISELGFLNPLELQEEIQAAFDLQLVDEPVIGWKSFQRHLLHSVEPGQCPMLRDDRPSQIADTVEELRDWYCFSEEYRRKQEAWKEREAERAPEEWYEDGGDELEDEDGDWPIGTGRVPVPSTTVRNETQRIGRNEPCPCGSGKKYKKCCLRGEVEF